jgi:hypothetical protein
LVELVETNILFFNAFAFDKLRSTSGRQAYHGQAGLPRAGRPTRQVGFWMMLASRNTNKKSYEGLTLIALKNRKDLMVI